MAKLRLQDIVCSAVRINKAAPGMQVANRPRGGITMYKGKHVTRIEAPLVKGAHARTVRLHELLHANGPVPRKSKTFPNLAIQATEDARLHLHRWPKYTLPEQANRDCLAVGLSDLRTLSPAVAQHPVDWNNGLLVALRSMAMVAKLGKSAHHRKVKQRVRETFGTYVANKLVDILNGINKKTWANREFAALMLDERTDERTEVKETGNKKGASATGKRTSEPMRVVRLPMIEPCNSAVKRTTLARSGARLNRSRLARAVATGSTSGLFIRQRYLAGGTFLFDASGSMQIDEYRMNKLCRNVPAATVAYYSGPGEPDDTGCYGELVIYAENGRRAVACDRIHGGNEIDYWAIAWLLKQPAPRVLVSDGGFCGGPVGQDSKAHSLLAHAIATGAIEWQETT